VFTVTGGHSNARESSLNEELTVNERIGRFIGFTVARRPNAFALSEVIEAL